MTTSIRALIVAQFDALMKTITTANGYETSIGNNVIWWRDAPLQTNEIPGMTCRDTLETAVRAVGQHEKTLLIEVTAFVRSSDSGVTARKARADLEKALGTNVSPNACLGGYAEDINPPESELIEAEHEGVKIYGVRMVIPVVYCTAPFDPYTQA